MLLIRERKPFGMLLFSDIDRIKYIMEKYLLCRRVKVPLHALHDFIYYSRNIQER
jgi:hypothetical protein